MARLCILSAGRQASARTPFHLPSTYSLPHTFPHFSSPQGRGQERKFCSDSFLSSRQLATMMELKTQFRRMLRCEPPHFGEGGEEENGERGRGRLLVSKEGKQGGFSLRGLNKTSFDFRCKPPDR